jgi:glycosyltransferase involved in cell wall biosynthesis
MKKILMIVENLPVPFDRRVWQEANTLVNAGYKVSVISPKGKGYQENYEEINGIHICRHPLPKEADGILGYIREYSTALFWEFILAWKVYKKQGIDIIHACNPPDLIFLIGIFYKVLFGVKFVFDHHDINPELYIAKFQRRDFGYYLMVWLERLTYKLADISIATNDSYKKIALQRGRMAPQNVFVVRSGPDLNRLKIITDHETREKECKNLVGYLGVMGKQEGIDYLLRAVHFIIFSLNIRDIHFYLVGGGTELNSMMEYSRALEVEEYVTFTGRISDEEMLAILNSVDICINSDIVNEMNDKSTMNKVMEYMALGKPIVQFDMTEGRVTAQEASLYAEPNNVEDFANKIVQLLRDEKLRKKMGQFGQERVRRELAWEFEAPKLLLAYQTLNHLKSPEFLMEEI